MNKEKVTNTRNNPLKHRRSAPRTCKFHECIQSVKFMKSNGHFSTRAQLLEWASKWA